MPEARIVETITAVGRDAWRRIFPGEIESFDYLLAVEQAGLAGFRWRYVLLEEGGRLVAAAPAFFTEYPLETTLNRTGQRVAAAIRQVFPDALTLHLACLGSPCTDTALLGFDPGADFARRLDLLRRLLAEFERAAKADGCGLLAVKDVPEDARDLWAAALTARYRPVPGLPVAQLAIDFDSVETYLGRLSAGTRRDMRRKLRARQAVRVEVRHDLEGVIDRVMSLYGQTRSRGEMAFEELTPAYFTGALERLGENAICVLYYADEKLLAANLLLKNDDLLLDKFFMMDAEAGRSYSLYFLSWFQNLEFCLQEGLSRYQSGQAAYGNKLRLGSTLLRTSMYFRHRNPVLNGVLRLVAPLLSADLGGEAAA